MASSVVNSPRMSKSIITNLALKIKREMKAMSSDAHDSILRDTIEAVKHFSWETVWLELSHKMPTLLSQLIHKPIEHKPILCFLASQLLKSRHQRMGLVQRAVSVMMYGNGTAKQVGDNDGQILSLLLVFIFYCTYRYLLICSPFVFACHIKGQWTLLSFLVRITTLKFAFG